MAESKTLQRLIQELEYWVQLSSLYVDTAKKRICIAKDVLDVASSQLSSRNESKQSKESICNLRDEETQISFQDEEDLLEEEIKRILQIAENVRDKAVNKHSHRSKFTHSSYADSSIKRNVKSEDTCSPGIKGSTVRSGFTSTGVKSVKKTLAKSDIKTVYQKDFSLSKSKSMPSLCSGSKSTEVNKGRTLERNCYQQDKTMVLTPAKALGYKQCAHGCNKDFIKINKQNLGLTKKETQRDSCNSRGVSELASKLLQRCKINESLLSEELARKSQLPSHSEVLMMLREVYHFLTGSNRKAGRKEVALKENFIERCNSSSSRYDSESELHGMLNILLPNCGWAYGRNENITEKDLRNIKDTITEVEDKLNSTQCSFSFNRKSAHDGQSEINCAKASSQNPENCLKESPFWHPLIMSSVIQGVDMPPFLFYSNVHEWISFQNTLLELHEYYIQIKILESINLIITEVITSVDSKDKAAENNDGDLIKSLARLLKAAAVMADFTGHLTVPILAVMSNMPIN